MSLHPRLLICMVLFGFLLAGCAPGALPASGSPAGNSSPTPFQPLSADTPAVPPAIWLDPAAPPALTAALPADLPRSADAASAAYRLRARIPHTGESTANGSIWVYVLAAPFPTPEDGITGTELSAAWKGSPPDGWQGVPFLLSAETLAALTVLWGEPAANAVRVLPVDQLLQTAWDEQHAWALLPFEALEPRWKVLAIDGISPLQTDFDSSTYPLTIEFALEGGSLPEGTLPAANRDPQKMTTLLMTGVTGLGRAVGARMDANGVDYPARDIGGWLRSADITHISNEVSFATDCPPSDPYQTSLRFCAQPRYFDLLTGLGVDVVELTGNHNLDWGPEAASYSLQLYREANIPVFGGAADQTAARQPALIEHHGNRLAFLGCNAAGPENAWATDDTPGAAQCGPWLEDAVNQLKSEGY
ncbi:MAG: CapA family protein, partial [Anaerolineaceae bacterium]